MKLMTLCTLTALGMLLSTPAQLSEQHQPSDQQEIGIGLSVCEQGECSSDLRTLRRLSRYGSGDASAVIALAYASGEGYEYDADEALRFLQHGVRQGSAMAMYLQSDWYQRGFLLPQDAVKAEELLDRAVAQNYAPALYLKASKLIQTHQPEDITKAAELLKKGDEQRHMDSMYLYARLQTFGLGTEQDLEAAGRTFRNLAIHGYPNARAQLQDIIDTLQQDAEQHELVAYFNDVDSIEVIQVVGQRNQLTSQLGSLARQLDNSGQYIRGSIGSRIRGTNCENSGSPCSVIRSNGTSSTITDMITGSQ